MINPWRYRVLAAVLIFLVMQAHQEVMKDILNNPIWMLVFHGSAALCDLMLIYSLPSILSGELCKHMETLCLTSIVGNALGWFAYMAYAPPDIYNYSMWVLSYIQWGRLLMVDSDDPYFMGRNMVRSAHIVRH